MHIRLLSICKNRPDWSLGEIQTYQKRLPPHLKLSIQDLPPMLRHQQRPEDAKKVESTRLLEAISDRDYVVALDRSGTQHSSKALATTLENWMQLGKRIILMIGGPDGLDPQALARADACWSLSKLTFPHALASVIVAEQLYRAHCILTEHPYHR